jgi:pimeloyl-ACP methyl ester carboxylesterase
VQQIQPGASFDIILGAGHWVQYETHDSVNTRLRELVKPHA